MKRMFAVMLLALASCDDPRPEQRARFESALPEGCEIIDLGRYGSIDEMVAIVCDGRQTVTTETRNVRSSGKVTTTDRLSVFWVAQINAAKAKAALR
jgi:hypothetical protein